MQKLFYGRTPKILMSKIVGIKQALWLNLYFMQNLQIRYHGFRRKLFLVKQKTKSFPGKGSITSLQVSAY